MYTEYEDVVIGLDEIHVNGKKEVLPDRRYYNPDGSFTWRSWTNIVIAVSPLFVMEGVKYYGRIAANTYDALKSRIKK